MLERLVAVTVSCVALTSGCSLVLNPELPPSCTPVDVSWQLDGGCPDGGTLTIAVDGSRVHDATCTDAGTVRVGGQPDSPAPWSSR